MGKIKAGRQFCLPGMHAPPHPTPALGKMAAPDRPGPKIFKNAPPCLAPPHPENAPSLTVAPPYPKDFAPALPCPTLKNFSYALKQKNAAPCNVHPCCLQI